MGSGVVEVHRENGHCIIGQAIEAAEDRPVAIIRHRALPHPRPEDVGRRARLIPVLVVTRHRRRWPYRLGRDRNSQIPCELLDHRLPPAEGLLYFDDGLADVPMAIDQLGVDPTGGRPRVRGFLSRSPVVCFWWVNSILGPALYHHG